MTQNLILKEKLLSDPQNNLLLQLVETQETKSREIGFYWENIEQLLEQVHSEYYEIVEAVASNNKEHLQEEIGDLIQAAIALAVYCKFDPSQTLFKSCGKFQLRYALVLELAKADGHEHFHQHSFEQMMEYWNRAKKILKNQNSG